MKFIDIKVNHILIVLLLLNISSEIFSKTVKTDFNYEKHGSGTITHIILKKILFLK